MKGLTVGVGDNGLHSLLGAVPDDSEPGVIRATQAALHADAAVGVAHDAGCRRRRAEASTPYSEGWRVGCRHANHADPYPLRIPENPIPYLVAPCQGGGGVAREEATRATRSSLGHYERVARRRRGTRIRQHDGLGVKRVGRRRELHPRDHLWVRAHRDAQPVLGVERKRDRRKGSQDHAEDTFGDGHVVRTSVSLGIERGVRPARDVVQFERQVVVTIRHRGASGSLQQSLVAHGLWNLRSGGMRKPEGGGTHERGERTTVHREPPFANVGFSPYLETGIGPGRRDPSNRIGGNTSARTRSWRRELSDRWGSSPAQSSARSAPRHYSTRAVAGGGVFGRAWIGGRGGCQAPRGGPLPPEQRVP